MTTTQYGAAVNLADLRDELTNRLALWLLGMAWLALLYAAFFRGRPATIGLFTYLLVLAVGARLLTASHPASARYLLVAGLTAGLIAAMLLMADPWLPFLCLLLTFTSAMLISAGAMATTVAVAGAAAWLVHSQARAYPLSDLFTALALGVLVTWLSVSTLYTALQWTWTMNQRANQLLKVVGKQQVELKRTVKSLEQINALQRRTQYELVLARKRAEQARRVTEQFAANISHELRTPLNLILGFSEMMQLSPEVYGDMRWPPKLRQAVFQIYRSSRHLMGLIDDILDLSRFEIGGEAVHYELTALEPLLRDTLDMVGDLFQDSRVHLEVDIAADVPDLDIDRTRIRQVLLNLLNNARRFTVDGFVRLKVKRVDGEVLFTVADTGPGIPADELPNIFNEFYQVDHSLRRTHGGTGLGLAICKRFIASHQGRIWAESEVGVGSTFYFTLPVPGQPSPPVSWHTPEWLAQPARPAAQAPILVVDSDPAVPKLVERHIGRYPVIQVTDVRQLAEEIIQHHPHAVLYNVAPGKRDHRELGITAPVPIIECSLPSQAWLAENLAVVASLSKPITPARLLEEVERCEDARDILVVDDEQGFCQLVERMLEATGRSFVVRYAHNGWDALEAVHTRRPDLVLLDLILPGLNGFEVLESIRQEPGLSDIPVILLSGTSFIEDALAYGKNPISISRPDGLRMDEIIGCLKAILEVLHPRYDERSAPGDTLTAGKV